MPGHITVEPLVDAKKAKEVGLDLVGGDAGLQLPKQSVEVVGLAQECALVDVE